jgi:hypothetical protein
MAGLRSLTTLGAAGHFDVELGHDRLHGRDLHLVLHVDSMVYQLAPTSQTGGAVQLDLNHSIHPLGLRPMGRGMPWLAAGGLGIGLGLAA